MSRTNVVAAALAIAALCGCTFNATLMARDSGRTYAGKLSGNGGGTGTMSVTIDGTAYSGPAARVASNESFGLVTTYGTNSRGGNSNAIGTSYATGDVAVKALLSSPEGRGLRCDLYGSYPSGGGVCVDDQKRVYDVIFTRS